MHGSCGPMGKRLSWSRNSGGRRKDGVAAELFCRWDLASAASLEICSCFLPMYVGVFMINGSCSESSNVLIHLKENTLSPADTSPD